MFKEKKKIFFLLYIYEKVEMKRNKKKKIWKDHL